MSLIKPHPSVKPEMNNVSIDITLFMKAYKTVHEESDEEPPAKIQ